ncbi:MAG: hypothetical protein ACRC6A_09175 [Fusobacteriaceae bacterium]
MISIQDLIKLAQEKKTGGRKEIVEMFVKELNGNIKAEIPTPSELAELLEGKKEDEQAMNLVYNCVIEPKLNDEILIQTLKCKEVPMQVVTKIMSRETLFQIAMMITNKSNEKMSEYRVELIDTVKN